MVVKIDSIQSNKYYRLYNKNNTVKFEFELKDKNRLNYYNILLQESNFEEFERILSH